MKKLKKAVSLLLCALLCGAMLAGCGDSGTPAPASDSPTSAGSTDPGTGGDTATPAKTVSGKVVYWSMWNEDEPQGEVMKMAKDMFEKANPDAEVEIQWFGRAVRDTVIAAINGGEDIDVFDFTTYNNDPTVYADISVMFDEPAIGQDMTFRESLSAAGLLVEEDEGKRANMGEGIHGVPCSPWVLTFFYNKALFEQAGVPAPPKTWTEFLDVCEKLKAAGIVPLTNDDAYYTMLPHFYLSRLAGAEKCLEMSKSPTAEGWTDGTYENMLRAMSELQTKGYFSPNMSTNKYPAGQQEFAMGEAAMYFNASWFPGEVTETAGEDFQWGQFAFPTVEGGAEDIGALGMGCNLMYVSSKSDNQEAAREFLKYVCSKEVQDRLSELGFAPCTKGSVWPDVLADQGPIVDGASSLLPWSANIDSDFVKGVIDPLNTEVINGITTVEDALKKAAAEAAKY